MAFLLGGLCDAAYKGDEETVRRLIDQNVSVNSAGMVHSFIFFFRHSTFLQFNSTPLHSAAYNRHLGCAKLLLKAKALPNLQDQVFFLRNPEVNKLFRLARHRFTFVCAATIPTCLGLPSFSSGMVPV